MQIIAPDGSVNGSQITIPPNSEIAGNGDAVTLFGLMSSTTEPTTLLSGRAVTLPTSTQVMEVVVGGNVNVTFSYAAGTYTVASDDTSILAVTLVGSEADTTTNLSDRSYFSRIWLSIDFCCPRHCGEALGFKVSDYLITVDGDELVAARTDGEVISVTCSASSPAAEKITLSIFQTRNLSF